MKIELLSTLRRIRACEDEAAARLLLEAYMAQVVAVERDPRGVVHRALFIAAILPHNQSKPDGMLRDAAAALFGQEFVSAEIQGVRA